jgi:uncharacterized protein (TIGR00725 family)
MQSMRRPMVAVCGSGAPDAPGEVLDAAEAVGRALVDAGFRVACGGLGGVMTAVCRGACASARWTEGTTVGILPSDDATTANPFVDVVIASGLGLARNVVLVASADAVVAVGGGSGTLAEMALAWQLGKPVVALDVGVGWSHELAGRAIDDRRADTLVRARSPEAAVAAVRAALGAR